ncbi:MAG: hypothetical protein ACI8YQ_001212 [Polaribacter sp.]
MASHTYAFSFLNPQIILIMQKSIIQSTQLFFLFILCLFISTPLDAQISKWSLNGQQIDFTSGSPVVNDLPGTPLQNVQGSGNSFYAPDGTLKKNKNRSFPKV